MPLRHSTSLRLAAATAPVRAASPGQKTSSADRKSRENTFSESGEGLSSGSHRNRNTDHGNDSGSHRRSSSSGSSSSGARGGQARFTQGFSSSTPHHQSHGRSGARSAAAIMQRHRNTSPYYYHTVVGSSYAPSGQDVASLPSSSSSAVVVASSRETVELVSAASLHSAYAVAGRRIDTAATALIGRGLSVRDEVSPSDPTVPATRSSASLRVLGPHPVATSASSLLHSPAATRSTRYEPFDRLFDRYIERGFAQASALIYHPEAPTPAVLLDRVLAHRTPCVSLTEQVLLAIAYARKRGGGHGGHAPMASSFGASAANSFALQRVTAALRERCEALYNRPSVRTLLIEALLQEGLYTEVVAVLEDTPDDMISPALWNSLVEAAAQSKLADSRLLWRLLQVREAATAAEEDAPAVTGATGEGFSEKVRITGVDGEGPEASPSPAAAAPALRPRSPFDVHASSVVLLPAASVQTRGAEAKGSEEEGAAEAASRPQQWVHLSSAEVGYAAEHYSGLNSAVADDRGVAAVGHGQMRLHPNTYAYLSDATASLVFDKSKRKAAAERALERAVRGSTTQETPEDAVASIAASSPTGQTGRQGQEDTTTAVSPAELHLLEKAAPAMVVESAGIVYGLDARVAAQLMLRAGVSFGGQASPLLALHILRRYLDSCHALRDEAKVLQSTVAQELVSLEQSLSASNKERHGGETDGGSTARERARRVQQQQRTVNTIQLLRQQADTALQGATPHPSPFLVFFKILRESRDVVSHDPNEPTEADGSKAVGAAHDNGASLPMVHWELAWHYFQLLNRENPLWYLQLPEEASDLCFNVLEVLCRGADPWMSLNVARAASARHIVDGLDMSLWILHHLDPSHHTEEAKEVTRKVFRWLLVDVGIHLHARLHHHLVPVTRVLLRLGLQDELKVLYNAVLDNVYAFSESFRDEFVHIMSDLVCPACASILSDTDVYAERVCGNCMTVVPAKDPATIPSFQLSAEHAQRIRERRKAQRAKSRHRVYDTVGRLAGGSGEEASPLSPAAALVYNHEKQRSRSRPFDAAELFKQRILNVDAAPLLPGVAVSSAFALFPVPGTEGQEDGAAAVLDVRAAMEESSRRLALQRAARQYALAQRGILGEEDLDDADGELYGRAQAALPSSSTSFSTYDRFAAASAAAGVGAEGGAMSPTTRVDGPWTCVWCQEQNSAWSSRTQCSACGAETGPSAPWRQFAYAQEGDVMGELRARISNAEDRPVDAIVAAYMLMLYRRTFLLRAVPHDQERIRQLIEKLCLLHERVLAAYIFTRFVPPPLRRKDDNVLLLAQMFGGASTEAFHKLSQADLKNDDVLFQAVFTPATCKVCFGSHDWRVCPIITRDFASASQRPSINLSPEEKQKAILEHLQRMVKTALEHGKNNSKLVVDAYASFVTSPFRELFAEVHPAETNDLSIMLSEFNQYRRAAFVLCHVPLHLRKNAAYLALCGYFDVSSEDAMRLLSKRTPGNVNDESHPNFVQVTRTCCMCLDQRHASFECPRLHAWLVEVRKLSSLASPSTSTESTNSSSNKHLMDPTREHKIQRRLKAQVDGWTSAGPERLHTFYRFMREHVDVLRPHSFEGALFGKQSSSGNGSKDERDASTPQYRASQTDPFVYALNKTITKLAGLQKRSYAYRLYARATPSYVSQATTLAMLRLNRFSDDGIRALLGGATAPTTDSAPVSPLSAVTTTSTAARAAAVPLKDRCLLCFHGGHAFYDCPELAARATLPDKLTYTTHQVGGIASTADGITAAAAYVYHTYNKGLLSNEMLRGHPDLVKAMLLLAHRCFAVKELAAGVRVLRRIPVEMVPPENIYLSLWRAAGLPEDTVEARRLELLALYDAEGLQPSIENPPPRRTYSARFMSELGHALHDGLCRHCYAHGHTIASCGVFHQEVGFSRDYLASYRMCMMSEQLNADWQDAYLLKLVDFFASHQYFMPYHIAGVANALNAIAAMWSFRGEPGIALAHLLRIPPAYRRRQAFKHILHCLQVPTAEISRVLATYYFSPDDTHASGGSGAAGAGHQQQQQQVVSMYLLMPKPAIRDVAMQAVFSHYPAAVAALEQSEQRMERIRKRNRVPASSSSSSTAQMKAILKEENSDAESPTGGERALPTMGSSTVAMQSGDITKLREDFDPILTELEDAVGMKLGSRHILFTSAIDLITKQAPEPPAKSSTTTSAPGGSAGVSPLAAAFAAAAAANATAAGASSLSTSKSAGGRAAAASTMAKEAEIVREVVRDGAASTGPSTNTSRPAHTPAPGTPRLQQPRSQSPQRQPVTEQHDGRRGAGRGGGDRSRNNSRQQRRGDSGHRRNQSSSIGHGRRGHRGNQPKH